MKNKCKKGCGEGYIDTCVLILCAMLVIALAVQVLPAFIAKQQLDTFATELVREAEIAGRIGPTSVVYAISRPHATEALRYPEESIIVG